MVMGVLASVPQLHLRLVRGKDWNGSYVSYDFDERAYSAYVQALIDGRPRRNDPYTGVDDYSFSRSSESLFSIQFLPAYALAIPARILGLSASDTFIGLRIGSAIISALAVFWLLVTLTNSGRIAAVGALLVLCVGPYAGSAKALSSLLAFHPATFDFPFLRRSVPAMPFPIFFVFCTSIYLAITSAGRRAAIRWSGIAGLCFGALLFSYFFLWTAAAAWFGCFVLISIANPEPHWKRLRTVVAVVGVIAVASLIPYVLLLVHRVPTMDAAQLLASTRSPDFSERSELFGAIVIVLLAMAVQLRFLNLRDPVIRFTISFALLPFVLFNYQVITGRSLQSFHYETYIAPYSVAVAAVLSGALLLRRRLGLPSLYRRSIRTLWCLAILTLVWASTGTVIMSRAHIASERLADEKLTAVRRMYEDLVPEEHLQTTQPIAFFTDLFQADMAPTRARYAVLWSPHMFVFSGVTPIENKERLFRYLYFSGVDEHQFESMIFSNSYLSLALFGFDRVWRRETGGRDAINSEDVAQEQRSYAGYVARFDLKQASALVIDYVVVPSQNGPDISNFDRWYERYESQHVGDFTICRVKLRQ